MIYTINKKIEAERIESDLDNVFMFCNSHIRYSPFKEQHYLIDDNTFLNVGDYVVKIGDDKYKVISKDLFEWLIEQK